MEPWLIIYLVESKTLEAIKIYEYMNDITCSIAQLLRCPLIPLCWLSVSPYRSCINSTNSKVLV